MKKFIILFLIGQIMGLNVFTQTITIESVVTNPGNILVSVNTDMLDNVGAVSMYIDIDDEVLTFNGITNVWTGTPNVIANFFENPPRITIQWFSLTGGVDFIDGKWLDIDLSFSGGQSDLAVVPGSVVGDELGIPLAVTFIDGEVAEPGITFNVKVFLEGAYDPISGEMNTDLLDGGNIPTAHPFEPSLPYYGNPNPAWYYSGSESVTSIPPNVVDWVLFELRDAASANQATSATIVAQKPCFVLSDGSVVDRDGMSIPTFYGITTFVNGAFPVIWHRNHLGIMSSIPVVGFGTAYFYDFTISSNQVAGGAAGCKELEPGVWGMVSGDANADKIIDVANDKNAVWSVEAATQGYTGGDFNLNLQIDNTDKNGFLIENTTYISGIPN